MQFLTAEILVFMVTVLDSVQSKLSNSGEHVCMKRETYEERTPLKKLKPSYSVKKSWCWDIREFFSCPKTLISWEEHVEYVVVPKSRMVARCCDGYVEEELWKFYGTTQCVPHCTDGCYHGKCLAPDTCVCHSGYYGQQCKKVCPNGYWGVNCNNRCGCFNGGFCNFRVGCVCTSGWTGERCELPCQEGFYGSSCKNKCDCASDTCNHVTGECITSSEPSTTISTTEVLLPVTTITKDAYPADITTESLSTSTAYFATEAFTDLTEKTTTTNAISTVVINEIPIQIDSDSNFVTEISTATEGTTEKTESTSSEAETRKETNLSEVVELESSTEMTSRRFTSTTQTRPFVDEITIANEKPETEVKINIIKQESNFRGSPENINIPDTGTISSTIFPETLNEPDFRKNKTSWIELKAGNEEMIKNKDMNKNKTDNFIYEEKDNSQSKETVFKFLHFLPSLSVISAVSFLMLVIAARWIIVNHRRKSRMVVVAAQKKNIFQSEEGVKFHAENLFWVNNCTINPVYTSDVDLNNTAPILETFKPVDKGLSMKERTIL